MMKKLIIGTRGSLLAVAQSEYIKKELESKNQELHCEIKIIVTSGDKDLVSNWNNSDKSLKSFFTKEIEQELLDGTIDIAVHSMKDMPSVSPLGLMCGAIPIREDNRDVLVSRKGINFMDLPKGSIIGTSSLRRTMGIKNLRDDLEIKQIRGNIHTRLGKLENKEYDAIVLAAAGLKRVGLQYKITEYFQPDIFIPAPAQGALYIQCREKDEEIKNILKSIHDEKIENLVLVEREFSKIFDGGCHTPMGCSAKKIDGEIFLIGNYFYKDKEYKDSVVGKINEGLKLASELARKIKEKINE
ncbi:MAG: hydroxymethylbilane synthase [Fusobacteriaceae bacterium]